ncbi:MAG TPA: hypothetical protein VMG13_19200 [Trebonia sp.]|nr:hypothetical protein [Trebonia sp.]
MTAAYAVMINLISAGIGAAVGTFWAFGKNKLRYRRQRAFWRFLEKPTLLVIGDLIPEVLLGTLDDALMEVVNSQQDRQLIIDKVVNHLYTQEISGLIGRGDLDAMVRILARIASLRFWSSPEVLHPSQVYERKTHNLILIGGTDTNALTSAIAPRIGCQLESLIDSEGHNVVRDSRLGVDHRATSEAIPDVEGGRLTKDFGIITRGPNPYNPDCEVLVLAGAHGLGSLAAAEICLDKKWERRLYHDLVQYSGKFECLVSYRRVDGGPDDGEVTTYLEFSRGLQFPPADR